MTVTLDFLGSQFAKILEEFRVMKVDVAIDRRTNAALQQELTAQLGRIDAKFEIGLQEITQRIDGIEEQIKDLDQRHVMALAVISDKLDTILGKVRLLELRNPI